MSSSIDVSADIGKEEIPKEVALQPAVNEVEKCNENVKSACVRKPTISILVGDIAFTIEIEKLQKHPETFLGAIFSQPGLMVPNKNGDYELDTDVQTAVFEILMEFYKFNDIVCPPNMQLHDLQEACDFFLVPYAGNKIKPDDLEKLLNYMNHETARIEFERFFKDLIKPMVSAMAENGEYDVHIIVLMDNDVLDLDLNNRPGYLAHLNCQPLYSTQLWRFMKFFANSKVIREVAKNHCIDFVTSGCEGFPIFDHSNAENCESPEYLYFRRPFIHMSWTELDEYYR